MRGLIARYTPGHPDYDPFGNGFDLTKLGVNMDSNEPLIDTWAGPMEDSNRVVPDFTLPAAYTVNNVPPLESKITSLSDETLMWIFSAMPRDVMQVNAARELYKRDWRFHKTLRIWLMKDSQSLAQGPMRLDPKTERGMYIVFNVAEWRRERKELILNFDDLDNGAWLLQDLGGMHGAGGNVGTPTAVGMNGMAAGFDGHGNGGGGAFNGGMAAFGGQLGA